jgi:hypothetical protein
MKQNIAFLLGSGISLKAGIPCTREITNVVLGGEDDGFSSINKFLLRIKKEVDDYYLFHGWGHDTTYEDLYSIISQLKDGERGEYDNPVILALAEKILIDFPEVRAGKGHHTIQNGTLWHLCEESMNYIKCVVTRELSTRKEDINYLNIFSDVLGSKFVDEMKIFTLNHDTLVEEYLTQKGIDFVDGFKFDGKRYVWDELNYDLPAKNELKLLKLHGSINWFYDTQDRKIIRTPLPDDITDLECPEILVGTINKILDYSNRDIYRKMHGKFDDYLDKTNILRHLKNPSRFHKYARGSEKLS